MSPGSAAPDGVPSVGDDPLVVVVAFHAPELLDRCLEALGGDFAVLVVDNSSDPSVEDVAHARGCSYLDPGRNLGFAGGVNRGFAVRDGRDVLLLNPDATITPDAVRDLHAVLGRDPGLAAVAPAQSGPGGAVPDRVVWPFPTPAGAWLEAVGLGRLRDRPDFLIGSVLLVASAALDDVGPFDDRFFLYAEESDWQRRAADRGWRVALCPSVTATHVGAGTGGDPVRRETHFQASHERYVRKHHGTAGWWSYRAASVTGAAARALVLSGDRGQAARTRLGLFVAGPLRAEAALGPGGLHVVQVVVTHAFAGVERYVCQVANGLTARGHRIEVVGGDPERMTAELDPAVLHHPADSVTTGALALLGTRGADLVHAHMTAAEGAAFAAHLVDRAPIVATRHFAAERGSTPLNRALARITSQPIVTEIAISEFVARSVSGPTTLIPNAVADRPQAPLEAPVVVMLQRLDEEKAADVGLRAWAASGLGGDGWRLVVAGTGILLPDLEHLVDRLGCAGSVAFAGQVADTDDLLAGASVFLAPAPAEPFGLSVAEAMSHGLPVVAAAGGAHQETVADVGLLFPPGDADAAAMALRRLAGDPALRRSVGQALRARQRERYALDLHLDRLESLYASVVADHRRRRASGQARAATRS
jgi:GT2 family glycosyltransferase/glycosyltransferase involved in cell wall biosynthesis